MSLTKQSIQRIIQKKGDAIRQYDTTLHFLCESIVGNEYEMSEKEKMLQKVKTTTHYSALLQELLKDSVDEGSREAFTDFLIDLDNVGRCIVPVADIPYSYADNRLLFPKVDEAVHWLTTTNQLYILSHPGQCELMVKHMHDIMKRGSPGIVLQIRIARQGNDNMLAFVVRSVMEGEGYSKQFISTECRPGDVKQFIDILLGDKYEYADIFRHKTL